MYMSQKESENRYSINLVNQKTGQIDIWNY